MQQTNYIPDWQFYFNIVGQKPASIAVDLGLAAVAPVAAKPYLAWVAIQMKNPRPDGLSALEETVALQEIEDALDTELQLNHKATYAGRLTSDARRTIYFYLGLGKAYEQTVARVMGDYSTYKYTTGLQEDKDWSRYFTFLYPEPEQLQRIKNRKVVDELEKHGDDLNQARAVDHWIYFRTEADRQAFLARVAPENFEVVTSDYEEELEDYPFRLQLRRSDKVDQVHIDKVVLMLWRLARQHNGDYDGWETAAVT